MKGFLSGAVAGGLTATIISGTITAFAQASMPTTPAAFGVPFIVHGPSGEPLLEVTSDSGMGRLVLHGPGQQKITIGATGRGMAIAISNSAGGVASIQALDTYVGFSATADQSDANVATLQISSSESTLALKKGGQEIVNLGAHQGFNSALRISSPSGKTVASIGSGVKTNGAGAILLSDSSGNLNGAWNATADGNSSILSIIVGGQPVVKLEPSAGNAGGKITLSRTDGTPGFVAGSSAKGGLGCAYVEGRTPSCLDPTAPKFP